jgi:dihydrofolate reductase
MKISIISAICSDNGIGLNNQLVWNIPEDMKFFREKTMNSIVIMGRSTYFSIREKYRPLPNRYNLVITQSPEKYKQEYETHKNLKFIEIDKVMNEIKLLSESQNYKKCFIIGGEMVYNYFIDKVDYLYLTHIKKSFECDKFFPNYSDLFVLNKQSEKCYSENEKCFFYFTKYVKNF